MKFFAPATLLIVALAAFVAGAPTQDDSFAIVERDTPTCFIDEHIGGTCNWKCGQRGASSGSCKTGTCVCSYSKRSEPGESASSAPFVGRSLHKRWSCQIGSIGGKGLSNALCSASCADATGGKKDGYCNSEDTCICKA